MRFHQLHFVTRYGVPTAAVPVRGSAEAPEGFSFSPNPCQVTDLEDRDWEILAKPTNWKGFRRGVSLSGFVVIFPSTSANRV